MIKPGVDLRGLQPQMAIAYTIAAIVYWEQAGASAVITSGSDGKHGEHSLHYKGKALDLRTNTIMADRVQKVLITLKAALGPQFDVVLESDHIHLEWDPKDVPTNPEER